MFRWKVLGAGPLFCAATLAAAQAPARPADPIFVRAQALVSDGNGVAGRALIDSVIAKTPPTSQLYPQALFWRATLAANAAEAESDYKHIVVDYPLAPQAEDALLRLAQLELARGDREGALAHLQRIPRDYPRSRSLARASYWTARVLFEKNDVANACAANASALAQTDASEVELRNQVQYQGQRCPSVATVATVSSGASVNIPTTSVIASTTPATASVNAPVAASAPESVVSTPTAKRPTIDTASPAAAPTTVPTAIAPGQRPEPPTEANDSKPSIVDPAKAPGATPEKEGRKPSTVTKPATATSGGSSYSVQVAAYSHKPEADKLAASLSKRGYAARVDGSAAPFRVRIGRYPTETAAEDALRGIRANHMDGFVVKAPER